MMLSRSDDSIPATDDIALKVLPLSPRWGLMYSGSPTYALMIVERAREIWRQGPRTELPEEMRDAVEAAYQDELKHQITRAYLAKYEMTLDQFIKRGRRLFGVREFETINKPIREFSLQTSLLVCGVDSSDFPHVFRIRSPSGAFVYDDAVGHAAIGSGAQMALGSLGSRKIAALPLRDLIFRVCEAKFAAETAHGVGRSTILTVWRKGFDHSAWGVQTEQLRAISERLRENTIPEDAVRLIDSAFDSAGVFMDLRKV
jgi:20S proteasome alpha/beta subunit